MSPEKEQTGKVQDIEERIFQFALGIVRLSQTVERKTGTARTLTLQLLKSATSVGANVEEAQAGQSRADFISKYSIALKEIRETKYWLRLMAESQIIDSQTVGPLLKEAIQLSRIIGAIVSRSKQNR